VQKQPIALKKKIINQNSLNALNSADEFLNFNRENPCLKKHGQTILGHTTDITKNNTNTILSQSQDNIMSEERLLCGFLEEISSQNTINSNESCQDTFGEQSP